MPSYKKLVETFSNLTDFFATFNLTLSVVTATNCGSVGINLTLNSLKPAFPTLVDKESSKTHFPLSF